MEDLASDIAFLEIQNAFFFHCDFRDLFFAFEARFLGTAMINIPNNT